MSWKCPLWRTRRVPPGTNPAPSASSPFAPPSSPPTPDTFVTRLSIAYWTGKNGDLEGALRLPQELLPDQERVPGSDHPGTLTSRSDIAGWTGGAASTDGQSS